jgi:hypothetical protein
MFDSYAGLPFGEHLQQVWVPIAHQVAEGDRATAGHRLMRSLSDGKSCIEHRLPYILV